jgi:hypothetical protein
MVKPKKCKRIWSSVFKKKADAMWCGDYCVVAFPRSTCVDDAQRFLTCLISRKSLRGNPVPWSVGASESFDRSCDLERRLQAPDMRTSMPVFIYQLHELGNYAILMIKSPGDDSETDVRVATINLLSQNAQHHTGPPSLFIDFDASDSPPLLPPMTALENKPLACTHCKSYPKYDDACEDADECQDCVDLQYASYMKYARQWLQHTAHSLWGVSKLGALRHKLEQYVVHSAFLLLPLVLRDLVYQYATVAGDAVFESLC